jgi:L-cysteine S-thiosulfotransferase
MRRGFVIAAALLAASAWGQGTEVPGVFVLAEKGQCAACHQLPPGVGVATRNDVGPRLDGARMRELGREGLRDVLVDPTRRNPESVMPPYGRHRLLDDREIERLIEFLHALP